MNDILTMQPGEELDALVAEKVFNRLITWNRAFQYLTEEERKSNIKAFVTIPEYSTDIAAAWEVVERMKELKWWFVLSSEVDSWTAMFYWDLTQTEFEAKETTAPEAIVKAALLALEGNRGG